MEDNINPETVWEAIQTTMGETFVYFGGFKEEANPKDVIKIDFGARGDQMIFQFSRFDFNPLKPAKNSTIRTNKSIIAFAWFVDPLSDVIVKLKDKMQEMDASLAGLILPGR